MSQVHQNRRTKLKDADKEQLFKDWKSGNYSYEGLSKKYNVSISWVSSLLAVCTWTIERRYGIHETSCENAFQFFDGGVKENHFVYCPYCGKEIKEIDTDNVGID